MKEKINERQVVGEPLMFYGREEIEQFSTDKDIEARVSAPSSKFIEEGARRFGKKMADWHDGEGSEQEVEQMIQFGDCISTIRRHHGITRRELAEQAQLTENLIFFLEKGLLSPAEVFRNIEKVVSGLIDLGVNRDHLVCLPDDLNGHTSERS